MASRPIEDRLGKLARRYGRWLLAASVLLYVLALTAPALQVFGGPLFGWECLIHGAGWNLLWLPNPAVFLAWIALSRKSQWSLGFSAIAFGMVVYSFAGMGVGEGLLYGAYFWLTAISLTLTASILLVAAKRSRGRAHFEPRALQGSTMDFSGGTVSASRSTRPRNS